MEKIYSRAEMYADVVEMYNEIQQWEKGYNIAKLYLEDEERTQIYTEAAEKLEAEGKLKDAERVFLLIGKPDLAIAMYKRTERYDSMVSVDYF